uniref:Fatty acid binding protein 2 n=1 Tax=Scleropages formosus TaxID=113540 RepID=A0A8C9SRW9_SCLFO
MAFNGTWKVEKSKNLSQFLEKMGEFLSLPFCGGQQKHVGCRDLHTKTLRKVFTVCEMYTYMYSQNIQWESLRLALQPVGFHCERCSRADSSCLLTEVNIVKRKLAEHDNLKLIINQTGDKFQIKESSTFGTKEIEFTLNVPFDYTLADGTDVNGTWVMEGNVLKGQFTRKDNGKVVTTTREITGDELKQSYYYEGVNATRTFKKS